MCCVFSNELIISLKLLGRANQRAQRLQEALRNIRGNAALLEDLLGWLSEAHALLAAKEKDEIPEDLLVVDALSKEHLVSIGQCKTSRQISVNNGFILQ